MFFTKSVCYIVYLRSVSVCVPESISIFNGSFQASSLSTSPTQSNLLATIQPRRRTFPKPSLLLLPVLLLLLRLRLESLQTRQTLVYTQHSSDTARSKLIMRCRDFLSIDLLGRGGQHFCSKTQEPPFL